MSEKEKLRLEQENADLKRQLDARRQADSEARQQEVHNANAAFVDGLVTDGRLAPAAKNVVMAMLDAADAGEEPVSYTVIPRGVPPRRSVRRCEPYLKARPRWSTSAKLRSRSYDQRARKWGCTDDGIRRRRSGPASPAAESPGPEAVRKYQL